MNNLQLLGSQTAKNGFRNEQEIINKFQNWKHDGDAQKWLAVMGYDLSKIDNVIANSLRKGHFKADANIQIKVMVNNVDNVENISVKLVSNKKGFNQIDKRKVDTYNSKLHWKIPKEVVNILKRFTGEISPSIQNPRDKRRMFINEFSTKERGLLFDFLEKNRTLILSDIIRGRSPFPAEWMLVAQKINENARWILKNINEVLNHYDGEVRESKEGSIYLGKVFIQRKGGTPDPQSLQFKINPAELFDI